MPIVIEAFWWFSIEYDDLLRLLVGYSIDFYKCRLSYEKTMPIVFEVSLVVFYTNIVYRADGVDGPQEMERN